MTKRKLTKPEPQTAADFVLLALANFRQGQDYLANAGKLIPEQEALWCALLRSALADGACAIGRLEYLGQRLQKEPL